ncbi:hypothetical protein [Thermobispora bispora]|uniref:hypothetical protein n=1 Tax=Thermobispora bispora TaxID=2006 RepID=UPI00197E059B|nr:hypothetical protein [Thermobispora bispora]QSI50009.1 hypothetical protein CYL17_18730 [Thermobispora bispora]
MTTDEQPRPWVWDRTDLEEGVECRCRRARVRIVHDRAGNRWVLCPHCDGNQQPPMQPRPAWWSRLPRSGAQATPGAQGTPGVPSGGDDAGGGPDAGTAADRD